MKLTKRILAMALALMMVLSLSTTAFAAAGHSHTITIKNSNEGYTYVAYQIFDGKLGTDGVLSNISWGSGINGDALLEDLKTEMSIFDECTDAKSVAAVLSGITAHDAAESRTFAEIANQNKKGPGIPSSYDSANSCYKITGLDDGYYLVVNTDVPKDVANTTYSRYVLEIVSDVTVAHKGDFPAVTKKIVEDENRVDTNEASMGDLVNYEIVGTIPSNIAFYDSYYYVFTDTLSKGLTYMPDTLKITVNGKDVTTYFYKSVTGGSGAPTSIMLGMDDLLQLENLTEPAVGTITHDTKVVITYSAQLNEHAVIIDEGGNPNKVKLEYDNNPNDDGDGSTNPPPPTPEVPQPEGPIGETPEDEVITYTTELTIKKVDGAGNILTGAEFSLTGTAVKWAIVTKGEFVAASEGATYYELQDGTFTKIAPVFDDPATADKDEGTDHAYKNPGTADAPNGPTHKLETKEELQKVEEDVTIKGFVNESGILEFTGLGAGTYTLTETVTPNGYNTISPITFTVEFDAEAKVFKVNSPIWVEPDNTLATEIKNVAGTVLPSTGGMGTTLFYIFGGLMFVGAAVLLVTKKRMAM